MASRWISLVLLLDRFELWINHPIVRPSNSCHHFCPFCSFSFPTQPIGWNKLLWKYCVWCLKESSNKQREEEKCQSHPFSILVRIHCLKKAKFIFPFLSSHQQINFTSISLTMTALMSLSVFRFDCVFMCVSVLRLLSSSFIHSLTHTRQVLHSYTLHLTFGFTFSLFH